MRELSTLDTSPLGHKRPAPPPPTLSRRVWNIGPTSGSGVGPIRAVTPEVETCPTGAVSMRASASWIASRFSRSARTAVDVSSSRWHSTSGRFTLAVETRMKLRRAQRSTCSGIASTSPAMGGPKRVGTFICPTTLVENIQRFCPTVMPTVSGEPSAMGMRSLSALGCSTKISVSLRPSTRTRQTRSTAPVSPPPGARVGEISIPPLRS